MRADIAELPDGSSGRNYISRNSDFQFGDALEVVLQSEIRDSMAVIAILHAAQLRLENK